MLRIYGYDTVTAQSGKEALAALEKAKGFQFVITDFAMPEMTGVELAMAIKAKVPGQSILLLTAHVEEFKAQRAPSVFERVMEKPFSMEKMEEAIMLLRG